MRMKLYHPLHNIQANIAAVYPASITREGRSLGVSDTGIWLYFQQRRIVHYMLWSYSRVKESKIRIQKISIPGV